MGGVTIFHQSSGNLKYCCGKELVKDHNESGTIKTPNCTKMDKRIKYNKNIEVQTIKLDDWIKNRNINKIDFIWADVEGAEREVIEGAMNTLNKTRYFYTEFSDNQMFLGQLTHFEILKMLPNFRNLGIFLPGNNILMENKLMNPKLK